MSCFGDVCQGSVNANNKGLKNYLQRHIDNTLLKLKPEMVEVLKAPLYQQAFRWFRENHGLYNEMFVDDDKTFGFLSLDKLIEIVKNKQHENLAHK